MIVYVFLPRSLCAYRPGDVVATEHSQNWHVDDKVRYQFHVVVYYVCPTWSSFWHKYYSLNVSSIVMCRLEQCQKAKRVFYLGFRLYLRNEIHVWYLLPPRQMLYLLCYFFLFWKAKLCFIPTLFMNNLVLFCMTRTWPPRWL